MYALATPFWMIAAARVKRTIGGRTIPLLAIFSAFTFAIMMFNVPVPGGTTAHGVGGTLTAIAVGPWAAVLSTSVALVMQALFFGDGGITAIGANCFNMGVMLPMTGYWTYRLVASGSEVLSQRRVVAAAVGAYVGITFAALLVALELGIQPLFWSTNGVPDYSPYGFAATIPTMLVAHMLGASFVEGAITALAVSYLQRSYPEILLGRREATPEDRQRSYMAKPWIAGGAVSVVSVLAVFAGGLWKGGGDIEHWAGLDWSTVDWAAARSSVLTSAIVSAVALPVLHFALRSARCWRGPLLVFVAIVIWVPIGLIAPGGAFAEDQSVTPDELHAALAARSAGDLSLFDALPDVNKTCECVPARINDVTFGQRTAVTGYQPPWLSKDDPAWQQNLGYQFAGLLGMSGLGLVAWIAYRAARWLAPAAPPDWRTAEE